MRDVANDEKFELSDVEEDGDVVTLTSNRDIDLDNGDGEDEEE